MGREDFNDIMERVDKMEDDVLELSDAVFGDKKSVADGLIKDMKYVRQFIIKWDKREYAWRLIFGIVGSNLILTLLGFLFILLTGGG